jgi:hypothetical protein
METMQKEEGGGKEEESGIFSCGFTDLFFVYFRNSHLRR